MLRYIYGGARLQITITKAANTDTLGAFSVEAQPTPEPSSQPTAANTTATPPTSNTATVSWTDSVGANLPSNYLVQCDTASDFSNSTTPTDSNAQSNDTDCKAGNSGVQNIAHGGSASAAWSGLDPATQYFFRIFAYSNSGSDIDYLLSSPATADATTLSAAPDNHPTGLNAAASSSSNIDTTWTDSTGSNLPSNYLVLCSLTNSFTNPVDGTAQTNETDCSGGAGIQNIAHGTQTASWSGLNANTQYFFKIFPSAGSGSGIVYKTDDTPQTANATTNAAATGGGDDGDETPTDTPAEEPTEQPSGAGATGNSDEGSVEVTWIDTNESPSYLVLCSTTGNFTAPTDGTPQSDDSNCADGSGAQNVVSNTQANSLPHGFFAQSLAKVKNINVFSLLGISTLHAANTTKSSTWTGLNSGATYYFKIYPYNGSGSSINYKIDGTPLEVNATTSGTSTPTNAGVFGGEKVTPTVYQVTVSKVEFKNAQGAFVTLAEDGTSFDVASVSANRSVGTFGKTAVLPNGSYSEIRVTLANSFPMTASGSDKGSACRTSSSGSTGSVSSTFTNVAIGNSDGGTASLQQVSYPSGSTASSALSSAGLSESGSNLQVTAPASFTVTDNSLPPNIAINIDVTDAVEVLTSGGNCHVLPQPPSVNVTVGG